MLVRWGGDEFIVLTQSDLDHALGIAQRISEVLQQTDLLAQEAQGSAGRFIHLSFGVAQFSGDETMDSLVIV